MSPWEGKIVKGTGTWEYVVTNATIHSYPMCHTDHMFRHACDYQNNEDKIVAWGYEGNGPRQLAYAILVHGCYHYDKSQHWGIGAKKYSEAFMKDVVSKWGDKWKITLEEVVEWIRKQETKKDHDEQTKPAKQVSAKD